MVSRAQDSQPASAASRLLEPAHTALSLVEGAWVVTGQTLTSLSEGAADFGAACLSEGEKVYARQRKTRREAARRRRTRVRQLIDPLTSRLFPLPRPVLDKLDSSVRALERLSGVSGGDRHGSDRGVTRPGG